MYSFMYYLFLFNTFSTFVFLGVLLLLFHVYKYFASMCAGTLYARLTIYTGTKEGISFSRTGAREVLELPCGVRKTSPVLLQNQ